MFNSGKRLGRFFSFKDKVPLNVRSLLLYRFTCSRCTSAYVGKTKQQVLERTNTFNPKNNNMACNNCNPNINNYDRYQEKRLFFMLKRKLINTII